MPITHPFVSAKSNGGDSTLVRPSNWNEAHTLPTHNETGSKQGGTTNEYYHLTSAQHASVVAGGFTDDITLGGVSNTTSFLKITHLAGADLATLQFIEYAVGYTNYPNNITVQISETGVNRDRMMLKVTDDMSGFLLALRLAGDGVGKPYVTFAHNSSSTDCPVLNFNMFAGQANPCIQFSDSNYTMPPMSAPPYTQVSSGSKGARTYYLKYTYVTSTGETTPCALVGPISMDANKLLRLTIPPAPDPRITSAKIYIHTSSGSLYWQDTPTISAYSTTTWTESTGALNTSGAAAPTSNSTGGVQFKMSSVYHGIGFHMTGVAGQGYDYVKIDNSSGVSLLRLTEGGAFYFKTNGFNISNASSSSLFYTTSSTVVSYVSFQANAGINLAASGSNTINATQGSLDMIAVGEFNLSVDASESIKLDGNGLAITTPGIAASGTVTITGNSIKSSVSFAVGTNGSYPISFSTNTLARMTIRADGAVEINRLIVNSNYMNIILPKTPASASATGSEGDICWNSSYIYVCVATNTWKRVPITTW